MISVREIDPGPLKRSTKFAAGVRPSSQKAIGRFQPLNRWHGNTCYRSQVPDSGVKIARRMTDHKMSFFLRISEGVHDPWAAFQQEGTNLSVDAHATSMNRAIASDRGRGGPWPAR